MDYLSSSFPEGPEINDLYERLRQQAFRKLLRTRHSALEDALASAVQDGFMIFLRKLQTADLEVQRPEAFAFEIIKRTFWDYRRRAQRCEFPQDPAELIPSDLYHRPRFADGDALFGSLPESFLLHWYQRLPAADQQLLDLRCQGYQDQEIADLLQRSHGGVRNRFSKLLDEARKIARAS